MRRFVNGDECDLDPDRFEVTDAGDRIMVRTPDGAFSAVAVRVGEVVLVSYRGRQYRIERSAGRRGAHHAHSDGELRAAMPGLIIDVSCAKGEVVRKGQVLLVLEAMKTHQPFAAPFDGVVSTIDVRKGDQVQDGQLLAVVEEA